MAARGRASEQECQHCKFFVFRDTPGLKPSF